MVSRWVGKIPTITVKDDHPAVGSTVKTPPSNLTQNRKLNKSRKRRTPAFGYRPERSQTDTDTIKTCEKGCFIDITVPALTSSPCVCVTSIKCHLQGFAFPLTFFIPFCHSVLLLFPISSVNCGKFVRAEKALLAR